MWNPCMAAVKVNIPLESLGGVLSLKPSNHRTAGLFNGCSTSVLSNPACISYLLTYYMLESRHRRDRDRHRQPSISSSAFVIMNSTSFHTYLRGHITHCIEFIARNAHTDTVAPKLQRAHACHHEIKSVCGINGC